jgi:hypothetical protein
LAEIVGDENIFALLHQYFVAILRCLGDRFGGLPSSDQAVYQTTIRNAAPTAMHTPLFDGPGKAQDSKTVEKYHGTREVEGAVAKLKISTPSVTTPAQCAPLSAKWATGDNLIAS